MTVYVLDDRRGEARRDWDSIVGPHVPLSMDSPPDGPLVDANGEPIGREHIVVAHASSIGRRKWQSALGSARVPVVIVSGGTNEPKTRLPPTERVYYRRSPVDFPTDPVFARGFADLLEARRSDNRIPWHVLEPASSPEHLVALYLLLRCGDVATASSSLRQQAWAEFCALGGDTSRWSAADDVQSSEALAAITDAVNTDLSA